MSIQTNPIEAISMLLKDVRSARRIFLLMERDEPFDAKLEKMMRELNSINELFMRVKKKEEELLDILAEVDEHLHKLDRKRLEDMVGICKRIRDSAHKLLPMEDAINGGQAITKAFD
ncbi:hypothetical protein GYH30_026248 [Glycine max]|nr:hypothetical protein GYH30_026248 [Glycine max]